MPLYNLIKMIKGKINRLIWGIVVISCFAACEKATITDVATADVFIKTIINQSDTLFGVAHSVASYNRMSAVSVKSPAGDSIPLPGIVDGGISIYKNPTLAAGDFKKTHPLSGIYTYDVTFKDKTVQVLTNTLGADYILPPVIISLAKSADGLSVILVWVPVPGTQLYQIRVTSGNNEVIPAQLYTATTTPTQNTTGALEVSFPIASFSRYMPGTFTVELDALLFESSDLLLLQAMGISNGTITLP